MYDMYHWDRSAPVTEDNAGKSPARARANGRPAAAGTSSTRPAQADDGQPPAAQALQVALDRRDNGGDARRLRDQ